MKLASIVPINNADRAYDGDYAMLLTHLSGHYPSRADAKNCYVIMDNSLIELGSAASIEQTYNAAMWCHADELVLPDVFRNKEETLKSVKKSLEWLKHKPFIRTMAVCQGKTLEDFCGCFRELNSIPEVHCIGIPKVSGELLPGGRAALEPLWQNTNKAIHLLGCGVSLSELKEYKHPELIRSCDTCIPALLSRDGIYDAWAVRPKKTIDLKNDSINAVIYDDIICQLREERFI